MYEETFSTDGECDRAEHASRRYIRRRFEHPVDAETHRRRKTPECMRSCFEHTVHADTHVNVQHLMHAIAIRTKTPKNNKGVEACKCVRFGKSKF
jgi:hypothetical protein